MVADSTAIGNAPGGAEGAPAIAAGELLLGRYAAGNKSDILAGTITLAETAALVRGDELAGVTAAYREMLHTQGKTDAADDFKGTRFPAVCMTGVVLDGFETVYRNNKKQRVWRGAELGFRQGGFPAAHTGLYQLDIDGVDTPARAAELRDALGSLPYVALAFVSPSYGVKAFVRGAPAPIGSQSEGKAAPEDDRRWKAAHTREWAYSVEVSAGAVECAYKADMQVKAVNGLCYLAHDADAIYNPAAIALDAAPDDWTPPRKPRKGRKPRAGGAPAPAPARAAGNGRDTGGEYVRDGTTAPAWRVRRARLAAWFLQTRLPGPGDDTHQEVWFPVCKAIEGLWGDDVLAEWLAGSARANADTSGLVNLELSREGETSTDWVNILMGFAYEYGWQTELTRETAAWYHPADKSEIWSATALGDAMRLMRANAARLLLVTERGADGAGRLAHSGVYCDNGAGVWRDDPDALQHMAWTTRLDWYGDAAQRGNLAKSAMDAVVKWRYSADTAATTAAIAKMAGTAYRHWLDTDSVESELTVAPERDLNSQLRYLGAPNGVVDLETGKLLTAAPARAALVTRMLPDDYKPDARHDDVDRLFAHLAADDRAWLLAALGYALRGLPSRRLYLVVGPGGNGKSTMLTAISSALGEYGGALNAGVLYRRRDGNAPPELAQVQAARMLALTEAPEGGRALDWERIRALTGGDPVGYRQHYTHRTIAGDTTATIFWACNEDSLPAIPLDKEAVFERLRVLRYPALPAARKADVGFANRLKTRAARQAIVAMVVRAAVDNPLPPDDCPSVSDARAELRADAIGEAGQWLLESVVADATPAGRLSTGALWDAALAESEAPAGASEVWGHDRAAFSKLARALLGLPPTKKIRVEGKLVNGWLGYRLATSGERSLLAADDAEGAPGAEGADAPGTWAKWRQAAAELREVYSVAELRRNAAAACTAVIDAATAMDAGAVGLAYGAAVTAVAAIIYAAGPDAPLARAEFGGQVMELAQYAGGMELAQCAGALDTAQRQYVAVPPVLYAGVRDAALRLRFTLDTAGMEGVDDGADDGAAAAPAPGGICRGCGANWPVGTACKWCAVAEGASDTAAPAPSGRGLF